MSEARRRALQQVDALESDLLLQSSEDLLPQHELRLIGFCCVICRLLGGL